MTDHSAPPPVCENCGHDHVNAGCSDYRPVAPVQPPPAHRFRKKPVVIEAVQWTGKRLDPAEVPEAWRGLRWAYVNSDGSCTIPTLEGEMRCEIGDWIIREPFPTGDRQFYPCKPDIFEATYERA